MFTVRSNLGRVWGAGAIFGLCLVAPRSWATDATAVVPARPWQDVAGDVLAAMGGRERLEKRISLHEKVAVSLSSLKMEGVVESWATKDNKTLRVTEMTGIPTTREGTDGRVYWSQDPVNGLRILEGAEKEQARIETAWMAELRLGKIFEKVESQREVGPHGEGLECLVMTPKTASGSAKVPGGEPSSPLTNCYDEKTHLQVSQRGKHASPQGDMPFTSELADYRDVDGIKLPFLITTTVGPISFTARLQEAKWDVPVKTVHFGLPRAAAAAKTKPAL
jgi:hypothetical protein